MPCVMQAFEAELSKTAKLMTAPEGTVWKAMWRRHGKVFLAAGLLKLVHDCVMFLGPFVLQQLLIFLEKGGSACKPFPCSLTLALSLQADVVLMFLSPLLLQQLLILLEQGATPCEPLARHTCLLGVKLFRKCLRMGMCCKLVD